MVSKNLSFNSIPNHISQKIEDSQFKVSKYKKENEYIFNEYRAIIYSLPLFLIAGSLYLSENYIYSYVIFAFFLFSFIVYIVKIRNKIKIDFNSVIVETYNNSKQYLLNSIKKPALVMEIENGEFDNEKTVPFAISFVYDSQNITINLKKLGLHYHGYCIYYLILKSNSDHVVRIEQNYDNIK